MNRVVICLGSNIADSENILRRTAETLRGMTEKIIASGLYQGPSHNGIGADYTNVVIGATTRLSLNQMRTVAHALETLEGRTTESKTTGRMPLDADIIEWNGRTEKPEDIALPHFTRGFEQIKRKTQEMFAREKDS